MGFQLKDGLSFCKIGERLVFLDLVADAYFCLPPRAEQAFVAFISGRPPNASDIGTFVDLALGEHVDGNAVPSPCKARTATSLFRDIAKGEAVPVPIGTRLLVRAHMLWTKARIRRDGSGSLLCTFRATTPPRLETPSDVATAAPVVAAFEQARLFLAADGDCLPRAISLATFLARARVQPTLVFGVRLDPFAAHCWVQVGTLLVDDQLDHVHSYTPILVI